MKEEKKVKILEQILVIGLLVSFFLLSAMCSSAVSVRKNQFFVFFIWFLTLALLRWFCRIKDKRQEKGIKELFLEKIYTNKEIFAVLFFVFLNRLFVFSDVPSGDAAIYYSYLVNACKSFDFTFNTFFDCFRLAGHPTLGYCFFMGIGEFLTPGRMIGYLVINLLLTLSAMYCLYQLFLVYWIKTTPRRAAMYTLLISCIPLFWGTFSYINPDYAIILFFIFMLYAESRKEYILMIFWLVVLCLTKETAILAVAGYFCAKIMYAFLHGTYTVRERFSHVIREKSTWIMLLGMLGIGFYFIRQGSLFAWDGMTLASLFGQGDYDGLFENRIGFLPEFVWNQFKLVFVLNFAWIFSFAIIILCLVYIIKLRNKHITEASDWIPELIGITGGFLAVTLFLSVFLTAPLNRYHIFTAVALPLIACVLYENIIYKNFEIKIKIETIVAFSMLILLTGQTFFSIDPISNISFEKMDTGKMITLETGGTFEDKYGDPMVNNFQYTWLDEELNAMLEGAVYDSDMVIIDAGAQRTAVKVGEYGGITFGWNKLNHKREIMWEETEDVVPISSISTRQMQEHLSPTSEDASHFYNKYMVSRPRALVYFVKYFNESEEKWLSYLSRYYEIGERKETNGKRGNIVYYELQLKNSQLYAEQG